MSIVVTDWYKGITKATQLTAQDVYSIVRSSSEDQIKSDEDFATRHELTGMSTLPCCGFADYVRV